jgi:murein DD-endopeptidase MepM/ murein hydrolase activator NlpD
MSSLPVLLGLLVAVTCAVAQPPAPAAPPAAVMRSAGVVSVPHADPAPAVPAGRFEWPLPGTPAVVRRFDPPPEPWRAGHRGVDLAAVPGTDVRAAGAGTVVFAGRIAGRGVVSVGHPGGLRTTYEPVDTETTLRPGDPVTAGERLGTLAAGHPGCPAGACLHWGLRLDGRYLDPLLLLGYGRVRLLPLNADRVPG